MRILVQNEWRIKAIFITIVCMTGSLFISRILLSVSLMFFIAIAVIHTGFPGQVRKFLQTPLLAGLSLLFFIPFVSGLWCTDTSEWLDVVIRKLPFLLLPLAFAGDWQLKEKDWRLISYCFIVFTLLACCQSLVMYLREAGSINESYLRAKTIPVPPDGDHVRFSWLVWIAIMISVLLSETVAGPKRWWLIAAAIFLAAYLHILSARTGLAMLYLSAACYALFKAKRRPRQSVIVILSLIVILVTGWFCFPTFSNRIRYTLYDLSFVKKNEYRSGTSDGNRVASFRAGQALIEQHPLLGVGAGDVWNEVSDWYDKNVIGLKESDKLYPSNEWLMYGCMAGLPGVLLFTGIIFLPLYIKKIKHRFFRTVFHVTAIAGFLVETSLEMQYGIFIYTFFGLWWWKWHCFENDKMPVIQPGIEAGMPERR